MWLLYQLAMASSLLVAAPVLIARRGRHYLETLPGRLGRLGVTPTPGALWLHAVSVGEVGVAATLARAFPPAMPLVVTTVTPTGQERARTLFRSPGAAVAYLPFDLSFAVERFFRCVSPAALILVEGDYWPLVLRATAKRKVPVAVVNGRVSERSFRRLRRLGRFVNTLYDPVSRFGMQTAQDRDRLVALGVSPERILVTGNLKYDTPEPPPRPELERALSRMAAGRPILAAGSTMAGEEELVLSAFKQLGGGRRAFLLLAPRHPERATAVARLIEQNGFAALRRSLLENCDEAAPGGLDVLLLDTVGELAALYRLATAAFIGGTLVPTGGHNPLEPARFAVPIVVGGSMENFHEIATHFDEASAWARVRGDDGLATQWSAWLDDPIARNAIGRRGAELLWAHRGAVARTVEMLAPWLGLILPAKDNHP